MPVLEIQGSPQEIAKYKSLQAYNKFKRPVIVEDTSLGFNAYHGLPGPYVKWFLQAIGVEGLAKMVEPFQNKSACALCSISYMNSTLLTPKIFIGKTNGKIVKPRGSKNFGWDSIFQPDQSQKTYGQMTKEQKNKLSHRYKAISQMQSYFQKQNVKIGMRNPE